MVCIVPPGIGGSRGPGASDRQITLAVTEACQTGTSLLRHPLDEEISERCMTTLVKSLDPMKVYFYQSDVNEFMKHRDELCDSVVKGGHSASPTSLFRTFLQRVNERVATVNQLLAGPLDFNVNEQMVVIVTPHSSPATPSEAVNRWRQRIKYDLLLLKSADKKEEKKEGQGSPR